MSDVASSALVRLHRIHRQLSDLRERLDRGPRQIHAAESGLQRLTDEAAEAKEGLVKARMLADQKQLQMKERESHIEDLGGKLNQATSNREYQALREQIAADEQANSVLADEILELLERIDEMEAALGKTHEAATKEREIVEQTKRKVAEEKKKLDAEVDRLTAELRAAEETLPGDFRAEYSRIASIRGEDALAPVEDMTCQGCYTTVTIQMINELRTNRPVFCKTCGRMLYLPEDRSP